MLVLHDRPLFDPPRADGTEGKGSFMYILRLTIIFGCLVAAGFGDCAAAPAYLSDFMTMTVCGDLAGNAMPGVVPGDPACKAPRKIKSGEVPPYQLNDFAAIGSPCPDRLGVASRENLPVVIGAVTRIVSFDRHATRSGCILRGIPSVVGSSIQWYDKNYGYIIGDATPTGLISFDSSVACRTNSMDSNRFSRSWVIAPQTLPPTGRPGFTVFTGSLSAGSPASLFGHCPTGGQRALTAWVLDSMTYTGGPTLPTLVSNHYSSADTAGVSAGEGQQMERTYWTVAFGLTRWEKWARADWAGGRAAVSVMARTFFAKHTCDAPFAVPAGLAPGMQMGPMVLTGVYSQIARDPRIGVQHVWYLLDCHDFTNLVRTPQPAPASLPASYAGWWTG